MKREVNSEICSNYYCYYYYSSVIQVRISSDLPYFVKRGKVLQDSNLAQYRRSRQKEQYLKMATAYPKVNAYTPKTNPTLRIPLNNTLLVDQIL